MLERTASSVSEILVNVHEILQIWGISEADTDLYFRGINKASCTLLPRLYRPENLTLDERNLFYRFQVQALSHLSQRPSSDWEWYFIAQHYGLPTRLLDWTENLFVGVYFALYDIVRNKSFEEVISSQTAPLPESSGAQDGPVIWILDADDLNRVTAGDASSFIPEGDFTAEWLPENIEKGKPHQVDDEDGTVTNEKPIALLPPRTTNRIIAQQGVFTIHGTGVEPLESYYGSGESERLARIIISPQAVGKVWRDLLLCGVHHFAVFPELDKLSEYIVHILK
jgi:hypothetical protein